MTELLYKYEVYAEQKALRKLTTEGAQIINQLKATQQKLGLLINFGHPQKLRWKCRIHTINQKQFVIIREN
ncbi:GxxExxY protein [Chloroflexota bacterium]